MPRSSYLLALSLIVLGLAVLIRVVAIGQLAYDVLLLPSMSGNDPGVAGVAVDTDRTGSVTTAVDAKPVPALAARVPEVSTKNPKGEEVAAKRENPGHMEKAKAGPRQARRQHEGYKYRYYSGRLPAYWGPLVW
jgi:hypothetical protein